jgi:PPOX class probable F420-dependent enzyme
MFPAAHVRRVVGMLDEAIKKLATGKNIAAVTTLLPDGTPMTQPLWVDADDDHLLLNTEVHRQKFRNIQRDPRVTVAIWDSADPYLYVEVRGEVAETVRGPEARAHIDELARKYTGGDYAAVVQSERVILKVAPTKRQFIRGE